MPRLAALALAVAAILGGPAHAGSPGENGRIVFAAGPPRTDPRDISESDLWTMNPDGTDPRLLTGSRHGDWSPNYSADGRKLVFSRSFTDRNADLMVIAPGGERRRLTFTKRYVESAARWSPDGRSLLFVRWKSGPQKEGAEPSLFVMDVATRSKRELPRGGRFPWTASWSPDGRRIVFSALPREFGLAPADLYSIRPDGTGLKRLTRTRRWSEEFPDFSPSGRRLVFARGRDFTKNQTQIWIARRDGSRARRIFVDPSPSHIRDTTWSPDGRWILYGRGFAEADVFKLRSDGSRAPVRLTKGSYEQFNPAWQPT